jgi:hypothetical protein
VSQPFQRQCTVPPPRQLDERLHEWWVENPWKIVANGKSLSGFERNRVFLNNDGEQFFEISSLTNADSSGDGRGVVATDFNADGRQDLIVRQAGGGPVQLFENRFAQANWLRVSLRGIKSNRMGIGARIEATIGKRRIVRELYPRGGFKAQGPATVHLGLGSAQRIDRLTVKWPSGIKQNWEAVRANRHLLLLEDEPKLRSFTP